MRIYIYILTIFTINICQAQRIGVWKVHLPHNNPIAAAEFDESIYVGTLGGMYSFGLKNGEVKVYSKADGLSDIEVSAIRHNKTMNCLVIAYNTSNIDIYKDEQFYNVNDIFKFPILGKKYIYDMYMSGKFAYLSCSFGIAKLDLDRKEIVESYQNLGPNGENIAINSVTINGDSIYAASELGLISASVKNGNLADFNQWKHRGGNACMKVATFNGKIYAGIDSIIQEFDGQTLKPFSPSAKSGIISIETQYDNLIITRTDSLLVYNSAGLIRKSGETNLNQSIMLQGNKLACCSYYKSLYFIDQNNSYSFFTPNSPQSNKATDFTFDDDNLWVATQGPTSTWILSYNKDYFFKYNRIEWTNYGANDTSLNSIHSIWKTAVRPSDNHLFFGSWGTGLVEYYNNKVQNKFDYNNSPLTYINIGGTNATLIGGMAFDTASNLWLTNAQSTKPLAVYTKSGQWFKYNLGSFAGTGDIITDVIIDDNNYKWLLMPRNRGIIVYNDNATPAFTFDDEVKQITSEKNNGYLPDMNVNCAVKDHDGNIWVGTEKGLTVFYTPGNIFNGQNYDAQQIIISKNGKAAYLFGDLGINHMAVDAGNRKWIATRNGVYLVSPDGQNIIFNFNKSNSPLLSDYVQRIAIHPKTGEVFFATDQGIVSYQGDALPGVEEFGEVIIYPNPVLGTYDGLIAIKGLYNNANVKITDIAGNLVYETRANGSVATWNGKNFKGERAQSGIYLVFSSNIDGSSTNVGKIMFYH